ncbi:globin domain-containing protein [Ferroacidibacillus organovorans]|uniref:Globin n=1 Tax=Ferroacidibacillus organovorans TaxID=1765683 RepID=A0A853KG17_9BACL|nr:globin [Ferroacidibacillus organovorans]KYP79752.1 globin [Ferroacidibacillus organovorans]OAG95341.1 globin [Ferroacidibacillus organovorans]
MIDSPYEKIGGEETIGRLVDAFYARVMKHEDLIPIFPSDILPVRDKQFLFLTQFLGGPPLYSNAYGHPMLRARHMPHEITPKRAAAWLSCMREAMDEIGLAGEMRSFIEERLTMTAQHMVNRSDDEAKRTV